MSLAAETAIPARGMAVGTIIGSAGGIRTLDLKVMRLLNPTDP